MNRCYTERGPKTPHGPDLLETTLYSYNIIKIKSTFTYGLLTISQMLNSALLCVFSKGQLSVFTGLYWLIYTHESWPVKSSVHTLLL